MRVIIAGSRDGATIKNVFEAMLDSPWFNSVSEVVSGGARGVDELGEEWARKCDVPVVRFPAEWNIHGRAAGPIRNDEMANYANALVAVWDGRSPGTMDMIRRAAQRGLPVFIWPIPKPNRIKVKPKRAS